jgi:hypothetical protein
MAYLDTERWRGTTACQETSGRVQVLGTARWEDPRDMAKA